MKYTLLGASSPGLLVWASEDAVGQRECRALGAWADLESCATRPKIWKLGASRVGHNRSGTKANMPLKASERTRTDFAPPNLIISGGCKAAGSNA